MVNGIKEEIRAAIRHALERGEKLNDVIISLLQAGYEKKDVFDVANEFLLEKKERIELQIPIPKTKEAREEKKEEKREEKAKERVKVGKEQEGERREEEKKKEEKRKEIEIKEIKAREKKPLAFWLSLISLLLIFYYFIGLFIKFKVVYGYLLFGLPAFLFSIFVFTRLKLPIYFYITALAISIACIPGIFLLFIKSTNLKLSILFNYLFFSKRYLYIIWAYLFSYASLIPTLVLCIMEKKEKK